MKPSREQILAEPAGPRLDAWLAIYVMEWTWHSAYYWKDSRDELHPIAGFTPSRFIEPAWRVVKQMRREGWFFRLADVIMTDEYIATFASPGREDGSAASESTPEAISKAALLAVLENQ